MRLMVLLHERVSPLGPLADRFQERGYRIEPFMVVPEVPDAPVVLPDVEQYDAVVTMGSRWSSYDLERVGNWVLPELELLRRADRAEIPVLGICFGGQMLATAHGGQVAASELPEHGWVEIETCRPDIVSRGPWFQWHGDRWTLPPEAVEIARNAAASQAFVLRRNLALQFHPEQTPDTLRAWLDDGGAELLVAQGVVPDRLLAETVRQVPQARLAARELVDGFLDHVAAAS